MKHKWLGIIAALLLFQAHNAYGKEITKTGPPADKTIDEPGVKNPKIPPIVLLPEKKSDFSHPFQLFKLKDMNLSGIQFETGLSFYSVSYDTWSFRRFEPFVKVRWALLGKYLSLYTIFSTDFTTVNYELSHFKLNGSDISFTTDIDSSGKHTFGGGAQILLFGWKKLNIFGYGQTQSTSISGASLKSAVLTINDLRMDIYEKVKDYIDITYTFERYDCGAIVSYQFLDWLTVSATGGFIWLNIEIKLALKQELSNVLDSVLGVSKNVVPDRLNVNATNGFGMLGVKFKLYKRLHLNVEGAVFPSSNPVYYGQISFSIE